MCDFSVLIISIKHFGHARLTHVYWTMFDIDWQILTPVHFTTRSLNAVYINETVESYCSFELSSVESLM